MKLCGWCLRPLVRREGERASAFAKRSHCDRSCQVSNQNHKRAQENRRARRRASNA